MRATTEAPASLDYDAIQRGQFRANVICRWLQGGGPSTYQVRVVGWVGTRAIEIEVLAVIRYKAEYGQVKMDPGERTFTTARNLRR